MGSVTLVSLMPELRGEAGHNFQYNVSIGNSARINGWNSRGAVPADLKMENLPSGWEKVLAGAYSEGFPNGFRKTKAQFLFLKSLWSYLRGLLTSEDGDVILFVESFKKSHLLALLYSVLFLPKRRLNVWIFYRYSPWQFGSSIKVYKSLNRLFQFLLGNRFALLTDSDLLAKSLSDYFEMPVSAMPVPHTEAGSEETFPKSEGEITCWWPGPPRPTKGLKTIKELASRNEKGMRDIRLVLAESADISESDGGMRIENVKNSLSREDYLKWLSTSDFILMPYVPYEYKEGTSGIFIECVCAGKIPLVTSGTWMAAELEKSRLSELAIDWETKDFGGLLRTLKNDAELNKKLSTMREKYLAFHNENGYAEAMSKILAETPKS